MRHFFLALGLATLIVGTAADTPPAFAADDTWVSATGGDSGACAITTPCRTVNYALAQTTAGGTITILSSGRYDPATITKSVHIMADGVEAVFTKIGACDAVICIDAGPGDVVSLHGITIQVPSPHVCCSSGIRFINGAGLHLNKCVVAGATTFAVSYEPNSPSHLHVFDSNLSAAGVGVEVGASGGPVHSVFDRSEMHDGNQGFQFNGVGVGSIQATIRNSLIANHHGHSILVYSDSTTPVPINLMVDHSVIANSDRWDRGRLRAEDSADGRYGYQWSIFHLG